MILLDSSLHPTSIHFLIHFIPFKKKKEKTFALNNVVHYFQNCFKGNFQQIPHPSNFSLCKKIFATVFLHQFFHCKLNSKHSVNSIQFMRKIDSIQFTYSLFMLENLFHMKICRRQFFTSHFNNSL